MTHRRDDSAIDSVLETLIDSGLDGMAQAVATLMNEAMKIERSRYLGAGSHERSDQCLGYANGYMGYLPTAAAFDEGGYEPDCARPPGSPYTYAPAVEETLTRTGIALARSLSPDGAHADATA